MRPEQHDYEDKLFAEYDISDVGKNFPVFHCHNVYEIYFLDYGERTVVIEDRMYRTSCHDAALIGSYALHRSFGNTPYSGICINFSDKYLRKYYTEAAVKILLTVFDHPVMHLTADEFHTVRRLTGKMREKKENGFLYLGEMLNLLVESAVRQSKGYHLIDIPALNPVIDYIAANFTTISGLEEISGALHMNKNYLCGLFKRKTGLTVSAYVNMLRIQLACNLLADGSDPDTGSRHTLEEIGEKCGYASSSYFCRTFKKLLGCTPGDFRRRADQI